MSFLEILKKNYIDFSTKIEKKEDIKEQKQIEFIEDPFIKDHEEEFDIIYSNKIYDIKLEFREIIDNMVLPFLNILNKSNYNFYDFIKFNSTNIDKIKIKTEKENQEYLKDLEEDNEEYNNNILDIKEDYY